MSSDPIGFAGGLNTYSYAGDNPLSYTDPKGADPLLAGIGAGIGGLWGAANGYLSGDRGSQLLVDTTAGATTGGIIGLTDGLSLIEGIGARAVVSMGAESYRQIVNGEISGCMKINGGNIAVAGLASLLGDSVGEAGTLGSALNNSGGRDFLGPPSSLESTILGGNASGAVTAPFSILGGANQGSGQ